MNSLWSHYNAEILPVSDGISTSDTHKGVAKNRKSNFQQALLAFMAKITKISDLWIPFRAIEKMYFLMYALKKALQTLMKELKT